MSAVIKSTPAAIEAINQMQAVIAGGLADQIAVLSRAGDTAGDPNNWEGPLAEQFRGVWGETKGALARVLTELGELREQLGRVQANIQSAGGAG